MATAEQPLRDIRHSKRVVDFKHPIRHEPTADHENGTQERADPEVGSHPAKPLRHVRLHGVVG